MIASRDVERTPRIQQLSMAEALCARRRIGRMRYVAALFSRHPDGAGVQAPRPDRRPALRQHPR
ncbi:MAG: hypothetical protein M3Q65_08285 [Chloroflexota bacterium]|nr:hypothetical protein [Chloroflexota bacterium]